MNWSQNRYWLEGADFESDRLAEEVYSRVLRQTLDQPGFAIVGFPISITSRVLREAMVAMKNALSRLFLHQWGEGLEYLSMGRFDQQSTTKLHLDGAPDRSVLMLGYEATAVSSEFLIADYSKCAHDLNLTPIDFLSQHNPMFAGGEAMLGPYLTSVTDWSEERPRIVVINNSSVSPNHPKCTHGVMHGARILQPDASKRRIINSTMIAVRQQAVRESGDSIHEFVSTDQVSGPIML